MSGTWHADDQLLGLYAGGQAGPLDGASLEQHLLRCEHCRSRIATHVAAAPLELVWERIQESAQAPAPGPVERLLVRLRVSAPDALLIAVAPSLRTSWLVGLAATLVFVVLSVAYGGERGLAFFLLVAPLVPVAGVAFAYGPDVDPTYEVSAAAPYAGSRLLLLRTGAVLSTCLPLVLASAALLPALSWTAVAWLLPALSFTAVVLAASTWTRSTVAAVALAVVWFGTVVTASFDRQPAAVLTPALLLLYAAVGVTAALVLRLRLRNLTLLGSLT
jgi:hypothetical protein